MAAAASPTLTVVTEMSALQSKVEALSALHQRAKDDRSLRAELSQLQDRLTVEEKRTAFNINQLHERVSTLEDFSLKKQTEVEALMKRVTIVEKELGDTKTQVEQLTGSQVQLEVEVKNKTALLEEAQDQVAQKEKDIQVLNRQLTLTKYKNTFNSIYSVLRGREEKEDTTEVAEVLRREQILTQTIAKNEAERSIDALKLEKEEALKRAEESEKKYKERTREVKEMRAQFKALLNKFALIEDEAKVEEKEAGDSLQPQVPKEY